MKITMLFILILIEAGSLFCQGKDTVQNRFTGRLSEDSRTAFNNVKESSLPPVLINNANKKSPLLAGVLSAILPGAGEFYSGSYIKAAVFLAVEASAIVAAISYNKQGDNATTEFQVYADEHWSVVRYTEWLNKFTTELGAPGVSPVAINNNTNLKPWERVNLSDLNNLEQKIPVFSHHLEHHGYQQYYELIGKYNQFSHGWDYWQGVPETEVYMTNVPQQMQDYSEMFLKPDKTYYKYAARAVTVILVNHLLSAIDAVWTAGSYNKNLNIGMKVNQTSLFGQADYYPELNLTYRF
ncbi:MAG: hypothetical protein WCJ01_07355 [Ignavibacteria bacterium]